MGQSNGINMKFDLDVLLRKVQGLEELVLPFTKKEMDKVINEIPADRAPRPDGFNGLFVKSC
jgi:hypothetical protein